MMALYLDPLGRDGSQVTNSWVEGAQILKVAGLV